MEYIDNVLRMYRQNNIIKVDILRRATDMAKTANVYVRIEPELKEEAETVLESLGIPASNAITMFYKQIILQRGLPFDVKLPNNHLDMNKMSDKQFQSEIKKGLSNIQSGEVEAATTVFENLRNDFNV